MQQLTHFVLCQLCKKSWAIEGAIGSEFKIDASYISPHVNIAKNIQGITGQYGVSVLLSGQFSQGLSKKMRDQARIVDTIVFKVHF